MLKKVCKLAYLCVLIEKVLSTTSSALAQTTRSESIRSDITAILSRPPYALELRRGQLMETVGEWLLNVLRSLADFLERVFRFGGVRDPHTARTLSYLVIGALIAGVAFALIRVLIRHAKWLRRARKRTLGRVRVQPAHRPQSETASQVLSHAREAARQGDWNTAYRWAFRALLLRLHELGIARYDPSRTTGEYLSLLRPHMSLVRLIHPHAIYFDSVVYGGLVAEPERVEMCLSACEEIESAINLAAASGQALSQTSSSGL